MKGGLIFGCGYLGRRVAQLWMAAGYEVFAVTRSQENSDSFRRSGIIPILADICEPGSLRDLPAVDVVLHAVGFDRNSGRTHEEVTCGGMLNILAAISSSRLITISSTSVYGQALGEWVNEDSECHPTQAGGIYCNQAERLAREWARKTPGASAEILRLAGIYGPGRLLSRIEALKSGSPLAGEGDSWLNLIHVDDAAAAVVACEKSALRNQTFIVVDNQPVPRAEYFGRLASLVGAPPPSFDSNQLRSRGSGGLNKRCSNSKIRAALDWNPQFPTIETGLPAAVHQPTD